MFRMSNIRLVLFACLAACASSSNSSATHPSDPTLSSPPPPSDGTLPPPTAVCPNIQLTAPDSVGAGTRAKFTAVLTAGAAPSFQWSVSAGRIVSGQGTPEITVDTGGLSGSSVTASLSLGNLDTKCATTSASASMLIGPAN